MKDLTITLAAGAIFAGAAAALGTAGYLYAENYQNAYLPGTYINGRDVSGRTPDSVRAEMEQACAGYSLRILFRGSAEEIAGSDFDYHIPDDGSCQRILEEQNRFLFLPGVLGFREDHTIPEYAVYDRDRLAKLVSALPELSPENEVSPDDAEIIFENGEFSVRPENEGTRLDQDRLINGVTEAVSRGDPQYNADASGDYEKPGKTADDGKLSEQCREANALSDAAVTYTFSDGTSTTIDRNTIGTWLVKDPETGAYSLPDEVLDQRVSEYVSALSAQHDSVGKVFPFQSTASGTVNVKIKKNGSSIDMEGEKAALISDIRNHAHKTREPVWKNRGFSPEQGSFGPNYIEVDLSKQHLYYYRDGQLYLETDCVTGKDVDGRRTPAGVYFLTYKRENATLRGEINRATGRPSYESHVNYWMPFYKGIGLHDALWRSKFGGEIYRRNGSHGCVNLPLKAAATIYQVIDQETPIIVF